MGFFVNINAFQQFCERNKKIIDKILIYLKNHKWLCVTIIAVILIFVIGAIVFHIEKQITIAQVSVNYNDVTLDIGETEELYATVLLSNNKQLDEVVWSSSNTNVVEVDQIGKITAVGKGTAEITAQATRFGATMNAVCTVNVKTKPTGYSILLSTDAASTSEIVKIYVETLPEDEVTNITVCAIAPSGEKFTRKLSDDGYYFYTETGTWTVYAVIENASGSYTGTKPEEIAYLEVSGTTYNSMENFPGMMFDPSSSLFSGLLGQ